MSCDRWTEEIVAHLYGEESDGQALAAHLDGCAACRARLEELRGALGLLREATPAVPRAPRVVLLAPRSRVRPWVAFAGGAMAAGLIFALGALVALEIAGARAPAALPVAALDQWKTAQEAAVRRELQDQWSRTEDLVRQAARPGVTRDDLAAEFARFQEASDRKRARERDELLGEITASELRTGTRLGQTQRALQYVALANDPRVAMH